MGLALPQLAPASEDRASGAQVIDGSLKFDKATKLHLIRTPGSAGNQRAWTLSLWFQKQNLGDQRILFNAWQNNSNRVILRFMSDKLQFALQTGGTFYGLQTNQVFRDMGWYHVVFVLDTTQSTDTNRQRIYVNGNEIAAADLASNSISGSNKYPTQNSTFATNGAYAHYFAANYEGSFQDTSWDGSISNAYLIDGQALTPDSFGYTDPLTNTWRPKKYVRGVFEELDKFNTYTWGETQNQIYYQGIKFPTAAGGTVAWKATGSSNTGLNLYTSTDNANWTRRLSNQTVDSTNGLVYESTYQYVLLVNGSNALWSNQLQLFSDVNGATIHYSNGTYPGNGNPTMSWSGPAFSDGTIASYNSFYLPLDGNSPIGEDKSGKGNNWTPVNFGGSVALDKATGAKPILNTDGGGNVARVGVRTDAYHANLVLALPLVGSANDVSNQINSGSTTKTITANGGAVASSAASNFYNGSFIFDGSGDYLSSSSSSDFSMGTGDFTVECWVYQTSAASAEDGIFQISTTSGGLAATQSNTITLQTNGGAYRIYANDTSTALSTAVITNKWVHLAVVRSSTSLNLFVNGVKDATTISDSRNYSGTYLAIGGYYSTSYLWVGNISDFRVYKGVAKYTSNFIPASTSPDILPDTPSGVSGGSKLAKVTDGAVNFDGSGDYLLSGASSDYSLGTGNFTIEGYIYPNSASGTQGIMGIGNAVSPACQIFYNVSNSQKVRFNVTDGTAIESTGTAPAKAWSHFAVVREGTGSNETKIYINGKLEAQGTISTNLTETTLQIGRPNTSSGTEYFNGVVSNFRVIKGTALYTANFTPPTAPLTNVTNTKLLCCQSNTEPGGASVAPNISGVNDGTQWSSGGGANFEAANPIQDAFDGDADDYTRTDNASVTATWTAPKSIAWSSTLKIRGARDSGTDADILVNGVDVTSQFTGSSATLETVTISGVSSPLTSISLIGVSGASQPRFSAVYIDDVMLVDPLTPNGDAAATNFNPFNTDINTVRGQESGYCTINPLDGYVSTKDGNLETSTSSGWQGIRATLGMNSGKFYWETQNNQDAAAILGIADSDATGFVDGSIFGSTGHGGGDANPAYTWAGANYYFNATTAGTGLSNHVPSDVVQYAFDADSGKLWFGRNGVWYNSSWGTTGNPAGGSNATVSGINTTKTYLACASFYNGSGKFNFGQKPFKFPPPAGFSPLNAANARPETVITRPDHYVGVTTYTGTTGAGTIKDDNIKFTPDFVWLKSRSNSEGHALYDTVRGSTGGNFYRLRSDTTAAENSPTNELSSMIRGGFTVNNNGHCYYNGYTYVAWTWKAGGNKNTFNVDDVGYASAAAAGLDGGTINPTGASVGTKQGFSIIKYTGNQTDGATVSHGLGKIPHFIIVKSITDGTYEWGTLNVTPGTSTGFSGGNLNNTETVVDLSNGSRRAQSWHAAPTSSVFSLGADGSSYTGTYNNNQDYIAYVWCDIPGLQKFGQYTGNGNTNGPFVELGFRPSLLIVKCATASGASNNWAIIDSTRSFANVGNHTLAWNSAGAESAFGDGASVGGASNKIDLLSNGFKMRDSGAFGNTDGDTYVYAAWAEAPAFNLYGGQSNAR